jgi:KDO2-lipid IV(A) lauroyltransferase
VKAVLLRVLLEAGGRLPPRLLYALGDAIATAAWFASPQIRATTRDHMSHVRSLRQRPAARERAARGAVRAAARYWADLARAALIPPSRALDEYTAIEGLEHVFAALDRGCGVILVTAHLGAPEFAVRIGPQLGLDVLALVQRNESPDVNELLARARRSFGARFAEIGFGGTRETLRHLRCGAAVAMVVDRDITGSGHSVPFFDERTTLPSGAIELALRTGAAVIPAFVLRAGVGRYAMHFEPPLEIPRGGDRQQDLDAGMLALACALEAGIERAPDQWFVLQPIWRGVRSHTAMRDQP